MEDVVLQWNELGVLDGVLKHKLVFIESKDVAETSLVLLRECSLFITSLEFSKF